MLNDDEKAAKSNKLSKAFEDLKKYKDRFKLYGIEQISAIDDIERIIDHEAKGYKLIVFIDMLHSVKDHNYSKNDRRYQLIELSRRIKILKSKYILAFFSVVEIRKSAKEGKEGLELEDIAETAKIGYDANAIFLMEEIPQVDGNVEENKAIIKLRVAKNKTSSFKGIIEYEFYTNRALFKEIL
jgi:hypothetical protein